jgi:arylformamidase
MTGDETRKVYLDYTQAELDKAYTQPEWASNMREVLTRQTEAGAALRKRLPPETFTYGPSVDETLDVFDKGNANKPIHVHIHGGAWRALTKEDVSFPAPVFVDAGAAFVPLNFSVIPVVRLPDMIAQVQRAIQWLYANAAEFGGDPSQIHLSGHSSGAHMASVLLTTDWKTQLGLPADVIKSGLLMSGSYDLEPVMLSIRSSYVKISKEEEIALSAIRNIDKVKVPLTIAVGSKETPEFRRQARAFHEKLSRAGKPATFIEVADTNHFEMQDVFADATSVVAQAALRPMKL